MTSVEIGQIDRSVRRQKGKRPKKQMYAGASLIIIAVTVISVITLNLFNARKGLVGVSKLDSNQSGTTLNPETRKTDVWWSDDYGYNERIEIRNDSAFKTLEKGDLVSFVFDHSRLVQGKKSLPTGSDFALVYFTKDNSFKDVPFDIVSPNSTKTQVTFQLAESVPSQGSDGFYYLYYGNFTKQSSMSKLLTHENPPRASNYNLSLESEAPNPLNASIGRKWIIKGGESIPEEYKKLEVKILDNSRKFSVPRVNLFDINNNLVKTYELIHSDFYYNSIDLSSLEPGNYYAQITGELDNAKRISPKYPFQVSYPLFVNWSMDWEGYQVEDKSLESIETISRTYGVPITHYFNPRIYVKSQDQNRSKLLTNWVKQRKDKGDEIELHLHMWFDLVEEAGVTVKKEPYWERGLGGHDVPETVYNAEEFDKLIKWSKERFKENGLPEPIGYRAGGWQINAEQLKVLANNNFLYDSSGRDYTEFGAKKMSVPWHLTPTTKPFRPGENDINKPGSPDTGIWEFPNNGDNSSNYGPNSTKNLDDFKKNYNGQTLNEKQTFVILSHVQLFQNDAPVLRRFFDSVAQNTAEKDSGPVVFTTIEKVLPEYTDK